MGSGGKQRRAIDVSRRIRATTHEAWRALVDPGELVAWFAEDAEVEPRKGGRYWVRWGEDVEGASVIDEWEPPHRLRLVHVDREGSAEEHLDEPIREDFTIQEVGRDEIEVRVVQRGIPASSDWDAYVEAEEHGWGIALMALAAHLEPGDRVPRADVRVAVPLPDRADDMWQTLVGPSGLALATVRPGEAFTAKTGSGDCLRGLLWSWHPPTSLMARVDDPAPAYLSVRIDESAREIEVRWSCYGWREPALAELEKRWRTWLTDVAKGDDSVTGQ